MISDIGLGSESFLLNDSISVNGDFFNFRNNVFNSNNLFFSDLNFLNFVVDQWDLNRSVSEGFNDVVNFNFEVLSVGDWNQFRDLNHLLNSKLHWFGSLDGVNLSGDFFNELLNVFNLFNLNVVDKKLLFNGFNFFDLIFNVWDLVLDDFNSLLNDWNLNSFSNSLNFKFFDNNFDNFFNNLRNLNDLFFIYYAVDNDIVFLRYGDWNLNWDNNLPIDFDNFSNFMDNGDDFIDIDFSWNLDFVLDNLIIDFLNNFNVSFGFDGWDNLFNYSFNNFFFNDVLSNWNIDCLHSFLEHWDLHNSFNFYNLGSLDDSVYNLLNNLRNFHNFFDDSGNNHNLLNDLFNFNDFGNLDHLLNDFVNVNSNLFNSLNGLGNFNNLLNGDFNWVVNGDLNNFGDFIFNDLGNLYNLFDDLLDLDNDGVFNSFNNNLSDNFGNSDDSFHNHRHLNSPFHNLFNFLNDLNCLSDGLFNFFYPVNIDNLFLNDFNSLNDWHFNSDFDNFLNNFENFNNLLYRYFNRN